MRYANYIVASLALTLVLRLLYPLHGRRLLPSALRLGRWKRRGVGQLDGSTQMFGLLLAPTLLSTDTNMAIDNS